MKSLFAILIASLSSCLLPAQKNVTDSYNLKGATSVEIDFQYGDLTIEKHSGSELVLEGSAMVNGEEALQYFEIESDKTGNIFKLHSKADFDKVGKQLTIVMKDGSKIFKRGKNISVEDAEEFDGEVKSVYHGVDVDASFTLKVPANLDLKVRSTYGSLTLKDYWKNMDIHSTYGDVDALLSDISSSPSFKIKSTYSDVDVAIPSNVNAELQLTTGYGQIYTDLDFQPNFKEKGKSCEFGQDISATLNKGGGSIDLDATYSNVYLRKAQ